MSRISKLLEIRESLNPVSDAKKDFMSSLPAESRQAIPSYISEIASIESRLFAPTEKEVLESRLVNMKQSFKEQFGISLEEFNRL